MFRVSSEIIDTRWSVGEKEPYFINRVTMVCVHILTGGDCGSELRHFIHIINHLFLSTYLEKLEKGGARERRGQAGYSDILIHTQRRSHSHSTSIHLGTCVPCTCPWLSVEARAPVIVVTMYRKIRPTLACHFTLHTPDRPKGLKEGSSPI